MKTLTFSFLINVIFAISASGAPDTILLEAEGFQETGGWLIDQQSIEAMGSTYLLAHGLGRPVEDAVTTVNVPKDGKYKVYVRTKDWAARWKTLDESIDYQPAQAPGQFQILINGKPTGVTLGTEEADWHWQDAGTIELQRGETKVTLHDLTGFEGRCDAIILTNDPSFVPPEGDALKTWRRKKLGTDVPPKDQGKYDLVIVGGGVAGCCTAISAARLGLDVALIQNRPVLGGNSSSEIRVWIKGKINKEPYPILGEIVHRLNTYPNKSPGDVDYGDDVKLKMVQAEKRIKLFLCEHVDEVQAKDGQINTVVSTNNKTGKRSIYRGRWFVDCTGDGTVGFLAGADFDITEKGHMGASNMWYTRDTGKPVAFPECPWAVQVGDKAAPETVHHLGHWNWESGFDMDTILDAETIRDNNFRGMYGVWNHMKNVRKLYPNREIKWAAYISGRRESRRLLGDVILTGDDIIKHRLFSDGCVTATWGIDLHYPEKKYVPLSPKSPFISYAHFGHRSDYPVPYRCFYSRNVGNLFMAGRNISVTHKALGTTRVMATCGMMGEVLGRAAYLCKKHDTSPRGVYQEHLDEFKELLKISLFDEAAVDKLIQPLQEDQRKTGRVYDTSDDPFLTTKKKYGDPFPAYWDGVWHLYTLNGSLGEVRHLTSTDLVKWTEHQPAMTGGGIATGSVIRHEGTYYLFYTIGQEAAGLVTSDNPWYFDKKKAKKIAQPDPEHYPEAKPYRDIFVFFNEKERLWWMLLEANVKTKGVQVALLKAEQLKGPWKPFPALYTQPRNGDKLNQYVSCPQVLQEEGTWYLTYLNNATSYHVADSPSGPWGKRKGHYNSDFMTAGSRTVLGNGRHLNWGFFSVRPTPETPNAKPCYGGPLGIGREMTFTKDKTIEVRPLPELVEAIRKPEYNASIFSLLKEISGTWEFDSQNQAATCCDMKGGIAAINLPAEKRDYYFEVDIKFGENKTPVGVVVRSDDTQSEGYRILMRPKDNIFEITEPTGKQSSYLTEPHKFGDTANLKIFICDGQLEAFLDNKSDLSTRVHQKTNSKILLETHEGEASFVKPLVHYFKQKS